MSSSLFEVILGCFNVFCVAEKQSLNILLSFSGFHSGSPLKTKKICRFHVDLLTEPIAEQLPLL